MPITLICQGYYFSAGTGSGADKWIIFFQGGGMHFTRIDMVFSMMKLSLIVKAGATMTTIVGNLFSDLLSRQGVAPRLTSALPSTG